MRRVSIITVVFALFLISSVSAGVSNMSAAKVTVDAEKVIIPLELENAKEMAALDLPLEFSDGVTLEEVVFEGTRAEDFDFKAAVIDNENNTVVIGMIPMVYGEKADLAPGSGDIAKLVFSIDDKSLQYLEVNATTIEEPSHIPMFVYSQGVRGQSELISEDPGFEGVRYALAEIPETENLPTEFALSQNYPNPFNPSTEIAYSIPVASQVTIEVLNLLGQKVTTLKDGYSEAGNFSVTWDGTDRSGTPVASGVYFYRINAGNQFEQVKKMMMLK